MAQTHHRCDYWDVGLKRFGERQKRLKVHRLVARAFIPNPDNKPEVNHLDCNRLNNHVSNLEWATPAENMAHAGKMGRMSRKQRGDLNANAKLKLTWGGYTCSLGEWAYRVGITYKTLHNRLYTLGWSVDRVLSTPVRRSHQTIVGQ